MEGGNNHFHLHSCALLPWSDGIIFGLFPVLGKYSYKNILCQSRKIIPRNLLLNDLITVKRCEGISSSLTAALNLLLHFNKFRSDWRLAVGRRLFFGGFGWGWFVGRGLVFAPFPLLLTPEFGIDRVKIGVGLMGHRLADRSCCRGQGSKGLGRGDAGPGFANTARINKAKDKFRIFRMEGSLNPSRGPHKLELLVEGFRNRLASSKILKYGVARSIFPAGGPGASAWPGIPT